MISVLNVGSQCQMKLLSLSFPLFGYLILFIISKVNREFTPTISYKPRIFMPIINLTIEFVTQ